MNKSALFSVYGNNVTIFNLTFMNSYYSNPKVIQYDTYSVQIGHSPIDWEGNYGVISNCNFIGNSASKMGGAISWNGNNGLIDKSIFINNTAGVIGGAIYTSGSNNTFVNCLFLNSTSKIGCEAIYVDRIHENCNIYAFFNGENLFFDGSITKIDSTFFNMEYEVIFAGEKIDLIPLFYSAILSREDYLYLDDNITCYAQYYTRKFIFTLFKDFGDGLSYEWNSHFDDIDDLSDVYKKLICGNYTVDVTYYQNVSVNSAADYERAIILDAESVLAYHSEDYSVILDDLNRFISSGGSLGELFRVLNVNFERTLTINSKSTWNPARSGFDTININGCRSTIKAESGDRDENKWATVTEGYIFGASSLTVTGFNTAVENLGGTCVLNHVNLDNNRMDYIIDRDWGAAILNAGTCYCYNCVFTNNYCSNGGAIFNQGKLELESCDFRGNEAYRNGNNILNVDKGNVTIDGEEITGSSGWVTYIKSTDEVTSGLTHILCFAASFLIGTIIGVATANPAIGFFGGAAVGAVIGTMASVYLIRTTYDVNYNRLKTCLLLIGGCSACGALGGCFGAYIAVAGEAAEAAEVAEEAAVDDFWFDAESSLDSIESSESLDLTLEIIEEVSEGSAHI